jgi:hypothetical protein
VFFYELADENLGMKAAAAAILTQHRRNNNKIADLLTAIIVFFRISSFGSFRWRRVLTT